MKNLNYYPLRDKIQSAKAVLPLPELLKRLGYGDRAKRQALCPFHADQRPSFSVFRGHCGWRWNCFAGCGHGDEIDFLEALKGLTPSEAIRLFLEMAGVR